jgi:hypothetical protein
LLGAEEIRRGNLPKLIQNCDIALPVSKRDISVGFRYVEF